MTVYPVILSGGSGTRLWPLSREHYPKQLLCLVGSHMLLQQTISRLDGLENVARPLLVCNEEYPFVVAEQVRQIGRTPAEIILEPVGRNTAPAATLAALWLAERDPHALMLVLPADHVIRDHAAFRDAIREGVLLAQQGRLVTFGVMPTAPEAGYGYIRRGKPIEAPVTANPGDGRERSFAAGYEITAFVEKPDVVTAQRYLDSGEYLWNSGMFLMRAGRWLEELQRHRPDILSA